MKKKKGWRICRHDPTVRIFVLVLCSVRRPTYNLLSSNYIYYRPHKMCYYKGQRLGLAWPRLQEAPFAESLASILLQPR